MLQLCFIPLEGKNKSLAQGYFIWSHLFAETIEILTSLNNFICKYIYRQVCTEI